ncbi:MAG: acyl-CoA thioesterase [Actinomycetota bacterium]|nr:acyl-CoA thioesterase [Actinomycetota bacterium]
MTDHQPRSVFLLTVRVRFHELDPLGHVNNAVFLTYLEEAAIEHAAAAGWLSSRLREHGGVFIARRHEIDFLQPAVEGDLLQVRTWAEAMNGARARRAYEIIRLNRAEGASPRDGLIDVADFEPAQRAALLVRARTEWAFVDVVAGRPRRIPAEVRDDFLLATAGKPIGNVTPNAPPLRHHSAE